MLVEKLAADIALAVQAKLSEKVAMIGVNLTPKGFLSRMSSKIRRGVSSLREVLSPRRADSELGEELQRMVGRDTGSWPVVDELTMNSWLRDIHNNKLHKRLPRRAAWDPKQGITNSGRLSGNEGAAWHDEKLLGRVPGFGHRSDSGSIRADMQSRINHDVPNFAMAPPESMPFTSRNTGLQGSTAEYKALRDYGPKDIT